MKTFLSLSIFFLLGGASLFSQNLEAFLPQDTLAYLSFPAGKEFLQQSKNSALGQLLQEAEMQPLCTHLCELLGPVLQPFYAGVQQITGGDLSSLYSSLDGELAFALIHIENKFQTPEILGSIGFTDQKIGVQFLQTIMQNTGLPVEAREQDHFRYQAILGDEELYLTWVGSKLFFSFHLSLLQALSENKRPTLSLKEVPEFQEISKHIASQKAFRFWLNTGALLNHPEIASALGKERAILSSLGLTQWTSFSFALWFHDLDLKTALQIGTDGSTPQGITKLFNTPSLSPELFKSFPKSSTTISAFQFDFAEFYQQIKSFILKLEPSLWKTAEPYIKMLETDLGCSVETVLGISGTTYLQLNFQDILGEQSVWLTYPKEIATWNTRLKQIFQKTMIVNEKNYRGKTIYSYRMKPGLLEQGLANFKPLSILQSAKEVLALPNCYFVDGNRVVSAHLPQTLMDFIDEMEQELSLSKEVASLLNSGVSSISWENSYVQDASGYYALCEMIALFLPMLPLATGKEEHLSSFDFPSAETILKYRRPGFSYATTGKNMLWISQLNLIPSSFPQTSGTTLIVGGATAVAIAIPGLLRSRISSNETSAIGTLRTLCTSQNQFQNACVKDRDLDGVGEYGFFTELAGIHPVPYGTNQGSPTLPTFMNSVMGTTSVQNGGIAQKSGYYFVLYLPSGSSNGPIRENGQVVPPASQEMSEAEVSEMNAQETRWCAYAWPIKAGNTGNKAFFVNQAGEVIATSNFSLETSYLHYSGLESVPQAGDVFDADGSGDIDASILTGTFTSNGLIWNPTS